MQTWTQVVIPGVPPSPNELKGLHPMQHHGRIKPLKELAWTLGQSARNRAGWPLPIKTDQPAPRYVKVWVFRRHLLDELDNLPASVKPLIDGLKGVLLVDDSPDWCRSLGVEQRPMGTAGYERVVIEVFLLDPRLSPRPLGRPLISSIPERVAR